MSVRIKTKVSKFHVKRLHEALDYLLFNNPETDDKEIIGNFDVLRINGNTYVSVTDTNDNLVMTCIEERTDKNG